MGTEIERKFLVDPDKFTAVLKAPGNHTGQTIKQAYLFNEPGRVSRVRLQTFQQGVEIAFLTMKFGKGMTRYEFNHGIPAEEAADLMENHRVGNIIEKIRWEIFFKGHRWEVDIFKGLLAGMIIAEIELESEDDLFELPPWVTQEVTGQRGFYNDFLSTVDLAPFRINPETT